MSLIQVSVPDIGDFDEVAVIELLVAVGDTVDKDQSLITVESDKASMEIPSSHAGVVKSISVKLGDKVKQGVVLLQLEGEGAAPAAAPASAVAAPSAAPAAAAPSAAPVAVSAPASSAPLELRVPDIGDFKDVAVIELLVAVGDTVAAEQSLITVESDKASMDAARPRAVLIASGILNEISAMVSVPCRRRVPAPKSRAE